MSDLEWLMEWYLSQCNGDWEHEYGVTIQTVDNPGWSIRVDLTSTDMEGLEFEMETVELGENDWWFVKVKDRQFVAGGDATKLSMLLGKLRTLVDTGDTSSLG